MTSDDPSAAVPTRQVAPSPSSSALAAAGVVGAGSSLALGELFAGVSRRVPSLVVAVADVLIGQADAGTARVAIDLFGTQNKRVLVVAVVVVTLAVGGVAAVLTRRWSRAPGVAYVLFGLVGVWAAVRYPLTSGVASALAAGLAASGGWVVTGRLLRRAHEGAAASTRTDSLHLEQASGAILARRRFVTSTIATGAASVAVASMGRMLRTANTVEGERAAVGDKLGDVLPKASPAAAGTPVAEVEGITPYLTPNDEFYRIDTSAEIPQIDPSSWSLTISGLVDEPLELSLDDLLGQRLVDRAVTLSCVSNPVGGGYAGNAVWTGVLLEDLFEQAGVLPEAEQVVGRSVTGWTGGFPREVVGDGRTAMVAVAMNGEPLPVRTGFPARLVVAGLYGYVSATKWLSDIELTRWDDFDAYWVVRGWAKEAPIKIASRIDVPRGADRRPSGRVVLGGVAWAPGAGVGGVEVFLDALGEWIPATLGTTTSNETWVQWSASVDLGPGTHVASVRAVDGNGVVQSEGPRPPFPDGAEGHHRIRFTVV